MKYNGELRNIDNQNKSYLLGLFYADGNISKNQHHSKLYLKDKNLVLKLIKEFNFFNYYKTKNLFGLQSGIQKVRNDFISNGCLPDKSVLNKDLLRLPFVNELTNHFIRGYFDGDGGCTLSNNGNKIQKRVYLYSASLQFLKDIQEFLFNNNIQCGITSSKIFKLTIYSSSYKEFYNLIYNNCNIFLERKRKVFDSILNTNFFQQKEAPECKFCKSDNTVYNGNYKYKSIIKPRVLCKDCKKNFTISAPYSGNIISGEDELLEG